MSELQYLGYLSVVPESFVFNEIYFRDLMTKSLQISSSSFIDCSVPRNSASGAVYLGLGRRGLKGDPVFLLQRGALL